MTRLEKSKLLYDQMTKQYESYLNVKDVYRMEADWHRKQEMMQELAAAKEEWMDALRDFQAHLSTMK